MRRVVTLAILLAAALASAQAQHFGGMGRAGAFRGGGVRSGSGFRGPGVATSRGTVMVSTGTRRGHFVGTNPFFFNNGFNNGFFFNGRFFVPRFFHHHRHRFFFSFGSGFSPFFGAPFFGGGPWWWDMSGNPIYVNAPPPTYVVGAEAEPVVRYEPQPPPPPREEPAYPQPSKQPAAAAPELPPTVLVFKDQHRVEVRNYAIVGTTLYVFESQRTKKIPVAELDVPATARVNEERGVSFRLPAHTKEVVTYP